MTCRFVLNGLTHANEILGKRVFELDDWKVIGEYVYDEEGGRHQAFYAPTRDLHLLGIDFKAGERVQVEQSLKYSKDEAQQLWKDSGLEEVDRWSALHDSYSEYFFVKVICFLCWITPHHGVHNSHGWHRRMIRLPPKPMFLGRGSNDLLH